MAGAIRHKEQYHHRCKCPKQFIWACDGDCENCEHHLGYGTLAQYDFKLPPLLEDSEIEVILSRVDELVA